jgi:hypothetical protein
MSPLTILIIILVVVLVFLFLRYVVSDPYTLSGVLNAKDSTTYDYSYLATDGNTPSNNFAYSVWFYINDWNYRFGQPKILFGRMSQLNRLCDVSSYEPTYEDSSYPAEDAEADAEGEVSEDYADDPSLGPSPAVILAPVDNNILVSLTCFPGSEEGAGSVIHTCLLSNVPIQKWVNLVISVYGRSMDLYIDGKLSRTCLLPGTANVNNYANVYLTPCGGFNGWTSRLQFFPRPLNPQDVWNIYVKGYSNALSFFGALEVEVTVKQNGTEKKSITF